MMKFESLKWKAFLEDPAASTEADLRSLMLDLRDRTLHVNRSLRDLERQSDPSTLDKVESLDRDLDLCELAMVAVVTELDTRRRKVG